MYNHDDDGIYYILGTVKTLCIDAVDAIDSVHDEALPFYLFPRSWCICLPTVDGNFGYSSTEGVFRRYAIMHLVPCRK